MNFLPAKWHHENGQSFAVADLFNQIRIPVNNVQGGDEDGNALMIGIRPEHIRYAKDSQSHVHLAAVEHLGDISYGYANTSGQVKTILHQFYRMKRRFQKAVTRSLSTSRWRRHFIFHKESEKAPEIVDLLFSKQ